MSVVYGSIDMEGENGGRLDKQNKERYGNVRGAKGTSQVGEL
jgi:hypothetical protein